MLICTIVFLGSKLTFVFMCIDTRAYIPTTYMNTYVYTYLHYIEDIRNYALRLFSRLRAQVKCFLCGQVPAIHFTVTVHFILFVD